MSVDNKYLEKIASTRLVKELAKGLSASVSSLVSKGALRSANTYAKGMKVGNANLSRAANVVHTTADPSKKLLLSSVASSGGGVSSLPLKNGKTVAVASPDKMMGRAGFNKPTIEMNRRHEIHEGKEYAINPKTKADLIPRRLQTQSLDHAMGPLAKYVPKVKSDLKRLKGSLGRETSPSLVVKEGDQLTGSHRSLAVLGREANDVRTNPHLQFHRDVRKSTGESALLSKITGKQYGVDKFTNKDLVKLRNAPGEMHEFEGGFKARKHLTE